MDRKLLPLPIALATLVAGLLTLLPTCRGTQESATDGPREPARNIRTTDPLSPEEERLALRLPPGFEAQLFAAEPDIGKPMNMAFDSKGRLWVTQSYEYPFADTTGAGRDKISILEDTDGDGRADNITTFADSLNIPIGIQPMPDGALAYSIPYIWHLIDRDGDDRVDERKPLYGPFQYNDTHGMVNNFVRSWDGWIHADHGFANTSRVAGSDGDTIVLNSGNTFRFRPDGSHLEFTTTGRVNPFGYAYDEWGYTYSVDCHTSPVYQIIRGADYPHFGKQPTGIGFGPALMKHDYGSTALAGLEYYLGKHFPEGYQNSFYYGDVVLSRVLRGSFRMQGTTPVFEQEEDFIVSDDPWFRPVDVKLGPDGALYIADFYNRIIGHYEVPLDHPGRDRQRGRIWRIVYTGEGAEPTNPENLDQLALETLLARLDHPNLPRRMAIADAVVDRFGTTAVAPIKQIWGRDRPAASKAQALWLLHRLDALEPSILLDALSGPNDTLRVHALRILFEQSPLSPALLQAVGEQLFHRSPHVRRQAVMVLSQNPDRAHVSPLLDLLQREDPEDTHFYYSIRQSLRDQLRKPAVLRWVNGRSWPEGQRQSLAEVMRGVDAPGAGQFLLRHLAGGGGPADMRAELVRHAARWLPAQESDRLVDALMAAPDFDTEASYPLFVALREGLQEGGKTLGRAGKAWAEGLAEAFLHDAVQAYGGWQVEPLDRQPYRGNTWQLLDTEPSRYLASGPMDNGGNNASVMYSPAFVMPPQLTFILRGHKNPPGEGQEASPATNRVELQLANSGETIQTVWVDGEDTDQRVNWPAGPYAGQPVRLAIVDGSAAWGEFIALGEFEDTPVVLPAESPQQVSERQAFAARLAGALGMRSFIPALEELLRSPVPDIGVRNAAAEALLSLQKAETLDVLAQLLGGTVPARQKEGWLGAIAATQDPAALPVMAPHLPEIPYAAQKRVVLDMAGTAEGRKRLVAAAEQGQINHRLLADPEVLDRLRAGLPAARLATLDELLKGVGDREAARDELIQARLAAFTASRPDIERGRQLFTSYCAVCHQADGQGGNIGPQLSGIGNWGQRALAEKILAPNRNISRAFKTYVITLADGTQRSGLFRREDGQVLVFADAAGQEFRVAKEEVASRAPSPYTLMPDHFGETIPEEDFADLLGYLLSLRAL